MDPRQVRAELDRILHSPGFTNSDRMARFLRCVVERALAGRGDELKEYLLGVEVFDRKADYDPRVDPIVRVEARRLRSKLEEYYERNGRDSEVHIELPKGAYLPAFRPPGAAAGEAPTLARPRSVAVLPIANHSRNGEYAYLCEGVTQEIIHVLTKATDLRVVAWHSAAHFTGSEADVYTVGRQLGVSYVLRGTLRASGGRVRLLAQLIDTSNGEYIWSESYDRQIADVFDIEQDISAAIVRELQTQLGACRRPTANPEVYGLYLKGRYHWNKRTEDGLRRAEEHFKQTIALEPDFALGHAGLADAYILLADYAADSPASVVGCAREAAMRALAIDPTLGEAEATLGLISGLHDWDWDASGHHYSRALELNPSYATAYHWYGLDYCALLGRFAEARQAADTAIQLDPLSSILRESIPYIHLLSRNFDLAEKGYRELIAFDPVFYKAWTGLGRSLYFQGRYEEAIEALLKGKALSGGLPNQLGALGQIYARAGRSEKAREILAELSAIAERRFVPSTCFAVIHLGLEEYDTAMECLQEACGQRELALATVGVHALWDPLRARGDFKELVRRLGLPVLA